MGNQHRNTIYYGRSTQLGVIPQLHGNPFAGQAEYGFVGDFTRQVVQDIAQGQNLSGRGDAAADFHAGHADDVGGHGQVYRIAGAHRRQDEARFESHFAAQAAHSCQQVGVGVRPHQVDEVGSEEDFEGRDSHLFDELFGGFARGLGVVLLDHDFFLSLDLLEFRHGAPPGIQQQGADNKERSLRHGRNNPHKDAGHPRDKQRGEGLGQLAREVPADTTFGRVLGTGDDNAGSQAHQQGRNLGNQTIADRQLGVCRDGVANRHAFHDHADDEAGDEVDDGDDDTGDSIAFNELGATVHSAVKVGLGSNLGTPGTSGFFIDETGVQVGIDSHLFTGHSIQGETRPDFRHTPRAVGNDDEVDDDQDDEYHHADHKVAAHHESPECLDDFAGFRGTTPGAGCQNQPGRSDVQTQPEQGQHQNQGRKHRKV